MKNGSKRSQRSSARSRKGKKANVEKSERTARTMPPVHARPGTMRLRIQSFLSQFIFQTRLVPITLVLFLYDWQSDVKIVVAFSFTCISTILLIFIHFMYSSVRMKDRIPPFVFMSGYAFTSLLGVVETVLYGVAGLPQPRITLLVVCFAYVMTSVAVSLIFILWIFVMRNK
ncbi:unnamed protein product [Bursaphelenchus xylophilus]|uniref:(pine wood nematode) hypothetical protein n=1 Tax=Bursaphelenchus xylophilus TaxID=6326 RepID=A0A1I7SFC4_BURXY|nr:unnamed protein product [Bursaphelenchus xylophilus]CAG9089689.1 unnamed protein product [Bursaphelenchus xylophilus]